MRFLMILAMGAAFSACTASKLVETDDQFLKQEFSSIEARRLPSAETEAGNLNRNGKVVSDDQDFLNQNLVECEYGQVNKMNFAVEGKKGLHKLQICSALWQTLLGTHLMLAVRCMQSADLETCGAYYDSTKGLSGQINFILSTAINFGTGYGISYSADLLKSQGLNYERTALTRGVYRHPYYLGIYLASMLVEYFNDIFADPYVKLYFQDFLHLEKGERRSRYLMELQEKIFRRVLEAKLVENLPDFAAITLTTVASGLTIRGTLGLTEYLASRFESSVGARLATNIINYSRAVDSYTAGFRLVTLGGQALRFAGPISIASGILPTIVYDLYYNRVDRLVKTTISSRIAYEKLSDSESELTKVFKSQNLSTDESNKAKLEIGKMHSAWQLWRVAALREARDSVSPFADQINELRSDIIRDYFGSYWLTQKLDQGSRLWTQTLINWKGRFDHSVFKLAYAQFCGRDPGNALVFYPNLPGINRLLGIRAGYRLKTIRIADIPRTCDYEDLKGKSSDEILAETEKIRSLLPPHLRAIELPSSPHTRENATTDSRRRYLNLKRLLLLSGNGQAYFGGSTPKGSPCAWSDWSCQRERAYLRLIIAMTPTLNELEEKYDRQLQAVMVSAMTGKAVISNADGSIADGPGAASKSFYGLPSLKGVLLENGFAPSLIQEIQFWRSLAKASHRADLFSEVIARAQSELELANELTAIWRRPQQDRALTTDTPPYDDRTGLSIPFIPAQLRGLLDGPKNSKEKTQ